jgi:hypothetical protein
MKGFFRSAMLVLTVLTLSVIQAEKIGATFERPPSILGRGGCEVLPPGVLSLCKRPPCPAAPPAPAPAPAPPIPVPTSPTRTTR